MVQRIEDKDGIWELNENGVTWDLVEESQEYLDNKNNPVEENAGPTQEELDSAAFEIKLINSLINLELI